VPLRGPEAGKPRNYYDFHKKRTCTAGLKIQYENFLLMEFPFSKQIKKKSGNAF